MIAAMSDAHYFGAWLFGALAAWVAVILLTVALCRAAAKPAPPNPGAQVVAEAEAIVRSAR